MSKANAALDQHDNSVRRRHPEDFARTGDDSPYVWDGVTMKKDGTPKLKRAGRSSNAGYGASPTGPALTRYKETGDFLAVSLMQPEAFYRLGPYPELWDTDDKATRATMNSLLVEGRERAGVWVKANRGTLVHSVLERVALAMIAGESAQVDVDDLETEAVDLGMTLELLEQARDLFIEFFNRHARPLASEIKVVHPHWNTAGTADLVLEWLVDVGSEIKAGEVTGGDLKTGRVDHFNEVSQAAQLAAYFSKGSMPYELDPDDLEDTGHPVEWEWPVSTRWAVVLQMSVDQAREIGVLDLKVHLVDLDRGVEVLEFSRAVSQFSVDLAVQDMGVVGTRKLQDSNLVTALRQSVDNAIHERCLTWLAQRIKVIVEHPQGTAGLLELWPDEIPRSAVKDGSLSPEHVNIIHRLLSHVEANCSLPFPDRDPRMDVTGSRKR